MNRQNGTYPRTDHEMRVRYIKVICPECGQRIRQQLVLGEHDYITILAHCDKRFRVRICPEGDYEIQNIVG